MKAAITVQREKRMIPGKSYGRAMILLMAKCEENSAYQRTIANDPYYLT